MGAKEKELFDNGAILTIGYVILALSNGRLNLQTGKVF